MIPACEIEGKIGIPTYLTEIEDGAEVEIPGLNYLVTVEDGYGDARRDDDGRLVPVYVIRYELMNGEVAEYVAPRMSRLRRYVPMDEAKVRAATGGLTRDEMLELVPALIDEVESLRTKLDESRRIRATLTPGGAR